MLVFFLVRKISIYAICQRTNVFWSQKFKKKGLSWAWILAPEVKNAATHPNKPNNKERKMKTNKQTNPGSNIGRKLLT